MSNVEDSVNKIKGQNVKNRFFTYTKLFYKNYCIHFYKINVCELSDISRLLVKELGLVFQ